MYKNLVPVSPERHRDLSWRGYENYLFTSGEAIVPICMSEMPRASSDMAIGFVRQQEHLSPAAICSLTPGKNYYVGPDGRWLGSYVPAILRAYPFALMRRTPEPGATSNAVVCIDEGCGLLMARADLEGAEPLFDENERPVGKFAQVIAFLTQLEKDRHVTRTMCDIIDGHGLLVDWPLKVDRGDGVQNVTGILRIDEDRLSGLPDEVFLELRHSGTLPFIYAHFLSTQRLSALSGLAQLQGRLLQSQPSLADAFEMPLDDDLEFNFD